MKIEYETRLLDVDVSVFIKKLNKAGAKFISDDLQIRNCYDFKPVRKNSWIRLRSNGKVCTLTIKEIESQSVDGTKESEIIVSDFKTTDEILNKLGFEARSVQENRRIKYSLNNVEIDIDFWPLIPPFVEIEASSKKEIENICKLLKIDIKNLVNIDITKIYEKYGIKNVEKIAKLTLENFKKNIKI